MLSEYSIALPEIVSDLMVTSDIAAILSRFEINREPQGMCQTVVFAFSVV